MPDRLHRFFANNNVEFERHLLELGVAYRAEDSSLGRTVQLRIAESSPHWPQLRETYCLFDVVHTLQLLYSPEEMHRADWFELGSTAHFGFPQPAGNNGYLAATYAADTGCIACGIGLQQIRPFRLSRSPSHQRKHVFSLNWVFGEFFLSSPARFQYEQECLTGASFDSPVLHRNNTIIRDWHQLVVPSHQPTTLDGTEMEIECCAACGRTKHRFVGDRTLRFLSLPSSESASVVRTSEWFGSGASAHQKLIVSRKFYDMAKRHEWRGVVFTPIEGRASAEA